MRTLQGLSVVELAVCKMAAKSPVDVMSDSLRTDVESGGVKLMCCRL